MTRDPAQHDSFEKNLKFYPADAERFGSGRQTSMAAGAGDHLMLSRLGLGEDNAEKAGSSTLLLHENVVSFRHLRCPPILAPGVRACLRATGGY